MVYLFLSPFTYVVFWLSMEDSFILGIFLKLRMVYEFDLLVRSIHPLLVIWYGLGVVEASWLGFYGDLHSLHQDVCVEGHDTGYDLHGFSLVLVIFLDVQISLTLYLRLVRDCDH